MVGDGDQKTPRPGRRNAGRFLERTLTTPSRELQQHKWSYSVSSLSGLVIASVAAGQQGGCQTSGIHLMLRNIRQTVDFAETLRALTSTEFRHEADTANRQCQCSLLTRPLRSGL